MCVCVCVDSFADKPEVKCIKSRKKTIDQNLKSMQEALARGGFSLRASANISQ